MERALMEIMGERKRRFGAATMAFVSAIAIVSAAPGVATASESLGSQCFEVGNPQWDEFRTETDLRVSRGELSQQLADTYKCDPRKAQEDLLETIEAELASIPPQVTSLPQPSNAYEVADHTAQEAVGPDLPPGSGEPQAAAAAKKKCVDGITLTHKLAGGTLTARQTLNWCWNGKTVSDWSGECTGSVSKWGRTLLWSFDGCPQNDFIPYKLNKRFPGGIHHKTKIRFTNKQWQVPDVETTLEQWGHYDGTLDQMVDGRLLRK